MGFKIIAIRPLEKCNQSFLKVLKVGQIYRFSNDYHFDINSNGEVHSVDYRPTSPENLFDLEIKHTTLIDDSAITNIEINLSAIVGKNGSGKSSIVELLYAVFYNFSVVKRILRKQNPRQDKVSDARLEKSLLNVNQFFSKLLKKQTPGEDEDFFIEGYLSDLLSRKEEYKPANKQETSKYFERLRNINAEVYYLAGNVLYCLKSLDKTINFYEYSLQGSLFAKRKITSFEKVKEAESLFYNLAINYSLYGLNSNESGDWISNVFHKNDSYQTPIVLNPFRANGIIDINSENYLVRSRLLANVLDSNPEYRTVAENKTVRLMQISFDKEKVYKDYNLYQEEIEFFLERFLPELYFSFFGENYQPKKQQIHREAEIYLMRKILGIPEKYQSYRTYYDELTYINRSKIKRYIKQLYQDRSHITLKVRQTLNFLNHKSYISNSVLKKPLIEKIDTLSESINKIVNTSPYFDELIDHLPPPFFNVEMFFDEKIRKNNFSYLSSGEKQNIYSSQSLIYHLRNILSVHRNVDKKLIKYRNINVVLDEIELYFHPEMQKQFVKNLMFNLRKINIKEFDDVKPSLNFIFITHSPFILSDIPTSNILFLENGEPQDYTKMKTFGANISNLLSDSFFIKNGLIGDFAKSKIEATIGWINEHRKIKDKLGKVDLNPEQAKFHENLIKIIDEPVIRLKLAEMFDELKEQSSVQKEIIQKEIDFLNKKMDELQ